MTERVNLFCTVHSLDHCNALQQRVELELSKDVESIHYTFKSFSISTQFSHSVIINISRDENSMEISINAYGNTSQVIQEQVCQKYNLNIKVRK